MKRSLLLLFTALVVSGAYAQDSYFGVRVAYVPAFDFFGTQLPLLGFQLGVPIAEALEVRAAVDTIVLISLLQADLLYARELTPEVQAYLGAGAGVTVVDLFRYPSLSLQGTVGLEYRTGGVVGFFAEAQPFLQLDAPSPFIKLAAGVNFHF